MEKQEHKPLPTFKYHPDPLATGMVRESDETCVVCGRRRGYVYVGSVAAIGKYIDEICPWCIADGSAHTALDATFTDDVGGHMWEEVPRSIEDEVRYHTPG